MTGEGFRVTQEWFFNILLAVEMGSGSMIRD
jgi:hypothetical protein